MRGVPGDPGILHVIFAARLEIILAFAATFFIPIHVSVVDFIIFLFLCGNHGLIHRFRLVILLWLRLFLFLCCFVSFVVDLPFASY